MSTILKHSRYKPAIGGHAPGDLRDAFGEAVDAYEQWEDGAPEPTVELREQPVPISTVCGLLWNCADQLPGLLANQLRDLYRWPDEPPPSNTYGAAARRLKAMIAEAA